MAFWRKSKDEYEKMADVIQQKPGILPTHMAKRLGVSASTVLRRLPGMSEAGYLVYEDDQGGLYLEKK